jgi:hypothetical protein
MGLWKGLGPNIARNAIINAAELASYDQIKVSLLATGEEGTVPCDRHINSVVDRVGWQGRVWGPGRRGPMGMPACIRVTRRLQHVSHPRATDTHRPKSA